MKCHAPLLISLSLLGLNPDPNAHGQEPDSWTASDASAHADHYNDPKLWDTERLASDAKGMQADLADGSLFPFPYDAFPAPDYGLTGRVCHGVSHGPLALPDPLKGSSSGVNLPFDSSSLSEGQELWAEIISDTLMSVVVSSSSPISDSGSLATSRSHPHYFYQGFFVSEHGRVDWSSIYMEGGGRVGVVNGRLLDLRQGNLILVRQHADGSIRIFQHRTLGQPADYAGRAEQVSQLLATSEAREFLGA